MARARVSSDITESLLIGRRRDPRDVRQQMQSLVVDFMVGSWPQAYTWLSRRWKYYVLNSSSRHTATVSWIWILSTERCKKCNRTLTEFRIDAATGIADDECTSDAGSKIGCEADISGPCDVRETGEPCRKHDIGKAGCVDVRRRVQLVPLRIA